MNERIVSEIELMSQEAVTFLEKTFEKQLIEALQSGNYRFENVQEFKAFSHKNIITQILLENLNVNTQRIISGIFGSFYSKISVVKQEKPLLDTILEDISRQSTQQKVVVEQPKAQAAPSESKIELVKKLSIMLASVQKVQ